MLDVDYHHGNGTQSIFYDRADVSFSSLHGDPHTEYPFFLGYADERGSGAGLGFNHNLPLPRGTDFGTWREALKVALQGISRFGAQALVVSLGLDTFVLSGYPHLEEAYRFAELVFPLLPLGLREKLSGSPLTGPFGEVVGNNYLPRASQS